MYKLYDHNKDEPENYILLKEKICKMNRKKILKDSGRLNLFEKLN